MGEARTKAALAKAAAPTLARAARSLREDAIRRAAAGIREHADDILAANARDLERARKAGMSAPLQDRLLLDEARIAAIADSLDEIALQDDPLGRVVGGSTLGCGLRIEKVTVPLGVVAMVYEARPNVTADAFALCIRSGNACVPQGRLGGERVVRRHRGRLPRRAGGRGDFPPTPSSTSRTTRPTPRPRSCSRRRASSTSSSRAAGRR